MSLSRSITYGVVGGYGATGSVVVAELLKSNSGRILIGGRDLTKSQAAVAKFGSLTAAAQLDVLNAQSLDNFCGQCSTIVNCAGPVSGLHERVAEAALRARCHYVDAAGLSLVKERLLPRQREIEELGLSFVISAGWMPGLSELLPAYAAAVAKTRMQTIESLTVYFADGGEWSDSALRDAAWYVHRRGLSRAGYFRRGEWTRAASAVAFRKVNLGENLAAGRFALYFTDEMEEIGRRCREYDVFAYTYLSGLRTALATTLMAVLPLPERVGIRMFRNVFRRNRLPVGGFVVAQVLGHAGESRQMLTVQATFEPGQDYWIHGVMMATAVRSASNGGARAGVHYLAEAVDPVAFVGEIAKAGVRESERMGTTVAQVNL